MNGPELPPLSPFARALVELEKARPEPPDAAKAAVLAGIEAAVGPLSIQGEGGDVQPTSSPAPSPTTPVVPASGAAASGVMAGKLVPIGLALFALGGAVGSAVTASVLAGEPRGEPPSPPPAVLAEPVPPPVISVPIDTPEQPTPVQQPSRAIDTRPRPPPAHRPPPSAAEPAPPVEVAAPSTLVEENLLLEAARVALARGRPAEALSALEQHQERFPEGQLAEERESLMVQALATSGRIDAARARAVEFKAKYPHSILLPVIEASLETTK